MTPYDGGNSDIRCQRKTDCNAGVVFCLFAGVHGDWPTETEKLGWWFFQQNITRQRAKSDLIEISTG